jgi:hypothetical protein
MTLLFELLWAELTILGDEVWLSAWQTAPASEEFVIQAMKARLDELHNESSE